MRVNLFDNGLRGRTGHHFNSCLRLAAALQRRGCEVRLHGTLDAEPEIGLALERAGCRFVPLFSHFAYAPLDFGQDVMAGVERAAQTMAAEFDCAAPADLNLFPSLKPLEFFSYALSGLNGPGVGYAHAEPFHQGPHAAEVWRLAADRVRRRGKRFRVGTIDPVVTDFLASYLGGMAVETFPNTEDGCSKTHYAETVSTIGFFGSLREERGMSLIAPLAEHLLAQGYAVVLHDTNGRFTNANGNPRLRVLDRYIDDLQAEMTPCDLVLCPMLREQYVHRMSGIVCNAVSAGVPFVLPAGTLAAARFGALGSSCSYLEHSVRGIVQAVQELAGNYPRYGAAARQAALQWRAEHGVEHFIDTVLDA